MEYSFHKEKNQKICRGIAMLNVGLLGAGRIGHVHAVNIAGHGHSRLVAVSDVNAAWAEQLAKLYGARADTTEAILNDPAIDAAGDVDTAMVTLHFADGRLAVIKNSRRAVYGYDQRLELLGA
jgi:predicted dehydrogenase